MITFDQILGQDNAIQLLRQAYLAQRLPHGLIFSGPAGIGKGTTAQALATLFLCEKPKADHPCGHCQSCTLMAAGNHPDFHRVYRQLVHLEDEDKAARDLSIDVVRDYLLKPASQMAALNGGKVFVVEEAERLSLPAQNAMLKTLEEPYGKTLIILLTDDAESLLPTIRSRCRLIRFAPLPQKTVLQQLEDRQIPRADAADLASFSEGSLGQALKWHAQGILPSLRELHRLLGAIASGQSDADLAAWLKTASEAYGVSRLEKEGAGTKPQWTREGLLLYLKQIARELRVRLAQSADPAQMDQLCQAIDALAQAEEYLHANVTVSLIFQQLAARLERLFSRPVAAE